MASVAKVLVPLYIYPLTETTWQPLYDAIKGHPDVEFIVIVNPNSGPGESALPSHDYLREVPKLNAYANVRTVGYVLTDYCRRPLNKVYADIDTYAGWSKQKPAGLGLSGIFLDETPNHYSAGRVQFLTAVRKYIKSASGLGGDRMVIHNPGTPPDILLSESGPDVVVTCEEPYERYRGNEVQERLRQYHHAPRKSGYMLSGVATEDTASAIRDLRERGAYLFVSNLDTNFYESFGESWPTFIEAMAAA